MYILTNPRRAPPVCEDALTARVYAYTHTHIYTYIYVYIGSSPNPPTPRLGLTRGCLRTNSHVFLCFFFFSPDLL